MHDDKIRSQYVTANGQHEHVTEEKLDGRNIRKEISFDDCIIFLYNRTIEKDLNVNLVHNE